MSLRRAGGFNWAVAPALLGLTIATPVAGKAPPQLKRPGQTEAAPAERPSAEAGKTPPGAEENPPEEDESRAPKEYAFNPIQASREVGVGDFYWKVRKDAKGAAARYREATRWNPQLAEAFRKLGDAESKLENHKLAREAYQKFLAIAPESKEAAEVKKRLQKLPAS